MLAGKKDSLSVVLADNRPSTISRLRNQPVGLVGPDASVVARRPSVRGCRVLGTLRDG